MHFYLTIILIIGMAMIGLRHRQHQKVADSNSTEIWPFSLLSIIFAILTAVVQAYMSRVAQNAFVPDMQYLGWFAGITIVVISAMLLVHTSRLTKDRPQFRVPLFLTDGAVIAYMVILALGAV